MLVDLPGYGYRQTLQDRSRQWQEMIFAYLARPGAAPARGLLIDAGAA